MDFDDEEDSKTPQLIKDQNLQQNQISENHEEYLSQEVQDNVENEEQNFHQENHEEEQENKNDVQDMGEATE